LGEYKFITCRSLQECEDEVNKEAELAVDPKELVFIKFPNAFYSLQREPFFVIMKKTGGKK